MRAGERLALAIVLLIIALGSRSAWAAVGVVLVATATARMVMRCSWRQWLTLLVGPAVFLLSTVIAAALAMWWQEADSSVMVDGVHATVRRAVRAEGATSALALVVVGVPIPVLAGVFVRSHVPRGAVDVLVLALRVATESGGRLVRQQRAARARGSHRSRAARWRTIGALAGGLAIATHARAHRIERGLLARGMPRWERVSALDAPARWPVLLSIASVGLFVLLTR
ncbi:MAG: hypothetical protein MUF00_14510 [Gemmatimonadaceae bacterium]|jgi:hypothetical protein|nr:hypothetical protein [Gemmatimonadaceae bacterium]